MNFLTTLALSCLLAIVVAPKSSHAQNASSQFEYRESDIGIDYRAIAETPLDVLLSYGEAEFFENATPVFGNETAEVWREMAAEIASGTVSNFTVKDMREFTPNMLSSFADLEHSHPDFGVLSAAGSAFRAKRFLEGVVK